MFQQTYNQIKDNSINWMENLKLKLEKKKKRKLDDGALHKVLDERMSMEQMLEVIPGRFFRRRRRRRHRRHFDFAGEEAAQLLFGVGGHQHFRWH